MIPHRFVSTFLAFYSFCFTSWVLSEQTNCKDYGANQDQCRSKGCEYDLNLKQCTDELKDCTSDIFSEYSNCQQIEGAFYAKGGILCRNKISQSFQPSCTPETIKAVNINGLEYELPSRKIKFQAETEQDYKNGNIRRGLSNFNNCKSNKLKTNLDFKNLLAPAVQGELGQRGCLTYPFGVSDGFYELTVWIVDTRISKTETCWDLKINSLTVLYGIDPGTLNEKTVCALNELIIRVKVENSGTQVVPQGFTQPVLISGKTVEVGFCMGVCTYAADKSFQVSAISLIKYSGMGTGGPSPPPPTPGPLPSTTTSPSVVIGAPCDSYGDNKNPCLRSGCEFNLARNLCVEKWKECTDEDFSGLTSTRRPQTFYVKAGVVCKWKKAQVGPQHDLQTLHGVNLGGDKDMAFVNSNYAISFHKEKTSHFKDPEKIRKPGKDFPSCTTRSDNLWNIVMKTYVTSKKEGCLTYPVTVKDGVYELGLMLAEPTYKEKFKRCFDIKFNGLTVAYAVDIRKFLGDCKFVKLLFIFNVYGSKAYVNGFPNPVQINKDKLNLKFCKGSCGYPDENFVVNAFYVSKLSKGKDPTTVNQCTVDKKDPCLMHGSNENACRRADCEYNLVTKCCVHKMKKCTDEDFSDFGISCRRQSSLYAKSGVVCSQDSWKPCYTSQIKAVNLNGESPAQYKHGDLEVLFKPEVPLDWNDPKNLRRQSRHFKVCTVPKTLNNEMLQTFIYGGNVIHTSGCVDYPIPINQDGIYELSVWTMETDYKSKYQRCFDIGINDIVVLSSVDILHYSPVPCQPAKLIILFKVQGGVKTVTPHGFPNSANIKGREVFAQFCFGKCDYPDHNFQAAAYYVKKITQ